MSFDENLNSLKLYDNDKYLAVLFAPKDKKAALAALFNYHYQVSQIPLEVSEQMIGMIKFQWWRDVFEEIKEDRPPRPHPILLGLQHSNVNYDHLIKILDYYEKLLDGWRPVKLEELEDFIQHTDLIIFEQAANIMEGSFSTVSARAYSYNYLARKLAAKDPVLSENLFVQSRELATGGVKNTVFEIITSYYNAKPQGSRWRLMLKLAFSRAGAI